MGFNHRDHEVRPFAGGAGQSRRDPVTMSRDDHPALASGLARRLEQLRQEKVEQLATTPCKDFHEYHKRIGIIEGLDIAIAQANQVNEKLNA